MRGITRGRRTALTDEPSQSHVQRAPSALGGDEDRRQRSHGEREELPQDQDRGEGPLDSRPLSGAFLIPPALPVDADWISGRARPFPWTSIIPIGHDIIQVSHFRDWGRIM